MSKNLLERIAVANPCAMDWEEMSGDAQKRYCSHCDKHVYNLSQMSHREAENLLQVTNGKLCARFERNADGTIRTADEIVSLPRFNHKFLRLAATTMSAALSLAPTINAKPVRNLPVLNLAQEKKEKSEQQEKEKMARIYGTVFDASEARVPNTKITLIEKNTGKIRSAISSDEGTYELALLDTGDYSLKFEANGFKILVFEDVEVKNGQPLLRNASLDVGGVVGELIMIPEPVPEQPALSNSLQLNEKASIAMPAILSKKNFIKKFFAHFKKSKNIEKSE